MPALPFFHPIKVEVADIDFMGHVNNARYLGWVQDAVQALQASLKQSQGSGTSNTQVLADSRTSYRDGVMIQLAYGLAGPELDLTRRQAGAPRVGRRLFQCTARGGWWGWAANPENHGGRAGRGCAIDAHFNGAS